MWNRFLSTLRYESCVLWLPESNNFFLSGCSAATSISILLKKSLSRTCMFTPVYFLVYLIVLLCKYFGAAWLRQQLFFLLPVEKQRRDVQIQLRAARPFLHAWLYCRQLSLHIGCDWHVSSSPLTELSLIWFSDEKTRCLFQKRRQINSELSTKICSLAKSLRTS